MTPAETLKAPTLSVVLKTPQKRLKRTRHPITPEGGRAPIKSECADQDPEAVHAAAHACHPYWTCVPKSSRSVVLWNTKDISLIMLILENVSVTVESNDVDL